MEVPAGELVIRAAVVYLALLILVRLSGKRTLGQFTPFDLLVVMLLSESVSAALSGGDNSLAGGLILAGTLIALNLAVAFATARNEKLEALIQGRAVLVGRNGEVYKNILQAQHISMADFDQALRQMNCELKDMHCAFLEADGSISVLKKSD